MHSSVPVPSSPPASVPGGAMEDRGRSASPAVPLPEPPPPLRDDAASLWMLDPQIDFLNHGAFGALPRVVAARQDEWRRRIEANPIELLARRGRELLRTAREAVGRFVGASPEDIAFVTNATDGVNAVLRSMDLRPGDRIVTTTHVYNAVRQTLRYVCGRAGAVYDEVPLPLPITSPAQVLACIEEALRQPARLVVLDHVTSPTALVFPVEEVARCCAERGIDLLVDGAHAPAMLPLSIESIGATFYAANLHKWTCAPKGCAFLWTRHERRAEVHPTIISHFLDQGYTEEFDWQGTRDISPWLCAPDALAFLETLGVERLREHNHRLATWVGAILCAAWNVEPVSPPDGSMLGSMVTVRLPDALQPGGAIERFETLNAMLYERFAIEVPVVEWQGTRFVRPCCQAYNRPEQYRRLAASIRTLAAECGNAGTGSRGDA